MPMPMPMPMPTPVPVPIPMSRTIPFVGIGRYNYVATVWYQHVEQASDSASTADETENVEAEAQPKVVWNTEPEGATALVSEY